MINGTGHGLAQPRNEWFVFSPIFLIVVGTLLVHAWRNTRTARPVLVILIITVLLYSAWWCWWLGGAYGYRGLVDLYGLLAIPTAWFFRSVLRRSWSLRIFIAVLFWALIRLNFGMMEHYNYDWFSEDEVWSQILEVVGIIAAGNCRCLVALEPRCWWSSWGAGRLVGAICLPVVGPCHWGFLDRIAR